MSASRSLHDEQDPEILRQQAARYRRLAHGVNDDEMLKRLEEMAGELEDRARTLKGAPGDVAPHP